MIPDRSIVITGAGGMLARAVRASLERRSLPHVALDRAACDITQDQDLRRLFAEHRPTLLINCAAHTKVDLCEQETERADAINGHGVGALAALAREHGTFLVHYSTDFVFPGTSRRPYRADDPTGPLSAYGRSKLLGEQLLQRDGPPGHLILRTAWLYGRGGPNFPRTIVERARQGQQLKVVNDQIGSPTWTDDLAEATFELLERGRTGIWHLTNSGSTSWYEFAKAAVEEFGASGGVSPVSTAEWLAIRPQQAHRPAYSVLDIEPFADAVGRPMRPWRQALHEFQLAVNAAGSF